MPMYNLIEHSDNYLKTPGRLWQCYRNQLLLDNAAATVEFVDNNTGVLFEFKKKVIGPTGDVGRNVEIMVPLKYLLKFWGTLETPLIN